MSGSKIPSQVTVATTARLHMGFFDLHGGLGRKFGSIGLALSEPATRLTVARAVDFSASGPGAMRALQYARPFMKQFNLESGVSMALESAVPEHSGLGSGTQMALSVGWALNKLFTLDMTLEQVAAVTERGARSGIGIAAFEHGGLLVDGGRGEATVVPPLLSRMAFPEDWRIVLIFDHSGVGVHGAQEVEAFRTLPEFSPAISAELCRYVLMQALPAIAEMNLKQFGDAVYEIQCRIGDYFAAAQGGRRFTSAAVGALLEWMREQGVACVGQSSWGPTGFAVFENELDAQATAAVLKKKCAEQPHLQFMVCKAHNHGCEVRVAYEGDLVDKACAVN